MLDDVARRAQTLAEAAAPKDTTRLVRKISRVPATRQASGVVQARVGVGPINSVGLGVAGPLRENQANYPYFVHQGTGIYGALHRMIRPRHALMMRFFGRRGLVFARSVAGQRPQPYIGRAYDGIIPSIPGSIDGMIGEVVDGHV